MQRLRSGKAFVGLASRGALFAPRTVLWCGAPPIIRASNGNFQVARLNVRQLSPRSKRHKNHSSGEGKDRINYSSCLLRFCAPVAQLDRALASEARGRVFESRRAHHLLTPSPSVIYAATRTSDSTPDFLGALGAITVFGRSKPRPTRSLSSRRISSSSWRWE